MRSVDQDGASQVLPVGVRAAAVFAACTRRVQTRQDADAAPDITHPGEVAALLAGEGGVTTPVTLVVAAPNDAPEDVEATPAELATACAPAIRDLVHERTDDKRLPKAKRKARQVSGATTLTDRAKWIRIADTTANVRDVTHHPPAHWDRARRRAYLDWAGQVAAGCRGANARLGATRDHVLREGRADWLELRVPVHFPANRIDVPPKAPPEIRAIDLDDPALAVVVEVPRRHGCCQDSRRRVILEQHSLAGRLQGPRLREPGEAHGRSLLRSK